jgi:hypothetical protein
MAEEPRYGNYDGSPSRFAPGEAWVLDANNEWNAINSTEHGQEVRELSKAEFDKRFPNTPPLPPEAFKEPRG